jgi:hypothetical protein
VQCAEKTDERQREIEVTAVSKQKNEEEKIENSDPKQPSIFDF